ncbi:DUF3237 family protein [Kineococcus sp. LSe6-4]|uniref:UPF0311 protein AB2L27_14650 n=1 Tax=Kineococcus halophytocola TaxID=3234027 RepID=A0ABV4H6F7_9ACTN
MSAPTLEELFTLRIEVGDPVDLGPAPDGHRRMVPITGGTLDGPGGLTGRVLPGGADHQVLTPGFALLDAQYVVETAAGERLSVHNRGVRSGDPADMAALARGEEVDPARVYFRCTPRLSSAAPAWAWVTGRVFVADAHRHPRRVDVRVFTVL